MGHIMNTVLVKAFEASQVCWSLRWPILLVLILSVLIFRGFESATEGIEAPIAGQLPLEPNFLTGLRFKFRSMHHLNEGYTKFKHQVFKVVRLDGMVTIVPRKWVDELRSVPEHLLSLRHLQVHNLYGKSTTTDVLLKSDLHARMLRSRLTPSLNDFATGSLQEMDHAFIHEFPVNQEEWTSMKIHDHLLYVVAAVTTRAISGTVLSRNRQWLSTCINYAENIFITMLILRLFPRAFSRWIAIFLPSSWVTYKSLQRGKKLLVPIIEERLKEGAFSRGEREKPLDLLQYMIEGAEGDDLEPERLAHLQLMVNLAGIHTTSTAITHAIHDLCEHKEYAKILREEVEDVLRQDGGWRTGTYKRLHKLDSFLKESQRFSPPTLLSFNRVALASITLSSGFEIPAGTHLSVASRNILFDPEITPDPDRFDGLRYYKLREKSGESLKHDFASVDGINMNFGAGRYACPGRFFASMELKLLLAKLLLEFDFEFPPGTRRKPLLVVDELVAPAPWAKVMMRRRQKVSQ